MGFTHISEDSSEIAFLLVENYNYDRFSWSSDRLGIFDHFCYNLCFSLIARLELCVRRRASSGAAW